MTVDRQEDIRNAIYNVFGNNVKSSKSGVVSAEKIDGVGVMSGAEVASNVRSDHLSNSSNSTSVQQSGVAVVQEVDENENDIGVPCAVCTLLNSPNERFCLACNHPLE